jgi:predicted alpha/beta-fold hydrolase
MVKYFNINEAGCSIRCKIYFNNLKTAKRIVVCGHGFSGHKDNKAVEKFADFVLKKYKDIAVITYDEPCHGDDVKKKLILEDCNTYIKLVNEYARSRFDTDELYAYANSFGGYQVLKYISEILPASEVTLSLMRQYTPDFASENVPKNLKRRLTSFEYEDVLSYALSLGFDGFSQDKESAKKDFTPKFDKNIF